MNALFIRNRVDSLSLQCRDTAQFHPHACIARNGISVDDKEFNFLVYNLLLDFLGELIPNFIGPVRTVEQEDTPVFNFL